MAFDLKVDVRAPRNRTVFFPPVYGKLRSDIRVEEISSDLIPGALNQVGGFIPGFQIQIDTKNKRARILDRLKTPAFTEKLEQVRKVLNTERFFFQKLNDDFRTEDCQTEGDYDISAEEPHHQLATWLWHTLRIVQHKRAVVVSGSLPEELEIRSMGIIYLGDDNGLPPKEGKKPFNCLYPPEPVAAGK